MSENALEPAEWDESLSAEDEEKRNARGWDENGNVRPGDDRYVLTQPEEGDPSAPAPVKTRKRR